MTFTLLFLVNAKHEHHNYSSFHNDDAHNLPFIILLTNICKTSMQQHGSSPGGGGGVALSFIEGDRDVPLDRVRFSGHQYWHRVSNRPNVVITIDKGYQNSGLLRLSQDHMVVWLASHPIVFYDRPAIQAEARTFFFFLSAQHPHSDRVYPRCAILQHAFECF